MTFPNEEWVSRQDCDDESRREYERERLILWTSDTICELMEEEDISKADLARALGVSRSRITQLLSGSKNITLSTLSELAFVLGRRATVNFERLRNGEFISSPVKLAGNKRPAVVHLEDFNRDEKFSKVEEIDDFEYGLG